MLNIILSIVKTISYPVFIYIFLLPQLILTAQHNYEIEKMTSNDGLSHNCVRCVIQDSKGFMWIGTENGLNRLDGYNIKEYINSPDDSNSISNNWIWTIYEDPADSGKILWIGTKDGLNKFNRETEEFRSYNINPIDSSGNNENWVNCIYKIEEGKYLIGGNGLKSFVRETGKIRSYLTSLNNVYIYSIYKDSDSSIWFGTNSGLFKFSSKLEKISIDFQTAVPKSLHVLSFHEQLNNELWIGTDSGFFIYLKSEGRIVRPNFKYGNSNNEIIYSIFEDLNRNLIATSNSGLIIINPDRDSLNIIQQLLDDLPGPYTRGDNRPYNQKVISAYIDRTGIIWIATCCNGLYKFIPDRKQFELFRHDPNNNYSLGSSWVTSFCEDKSGNVYVGTIGGNLNQFNRSTNRFLRIDLSIESYSIREGINNDIWYSNLYSLVNFNLDNMMSTAYFGHGVSNTLKFPISQNNDENDALRKKIWDSLFVNFDLSQIKDYPTIEYIHIDKAGTIWCVFAKDSSDSRNLYTFNPNSKSFNQYEIYTEDLISNSITNIYEDRKGNLWFGTDGKGLVKRVIQNSTHDNNTFSYVQYKHKKNNNSTLSNNIIYPIVEDNDGIMWIGTANGLNKFNPVNEKFTRYYVIDGLPSELITGILADNEGLLWISTNKGLSKFNPRTEEFKNFNIQDGLQSNNFSFGSSYKAKNGDMYFGGPNGFNLFNPENIEENPYAPKVVINGFRLFNEPVKPGKDSPLRKNIEVTENIILEYDKDIFGFEFVALDFTNPMKNQYAYKMEGVNPDWIYTGADRRFATYTKLDPGKYVFRVKASNSDGIWNEQGASINITILPPWYRTVWAYIFYALLVISIVAYTWFIQKRRIRLHHEMEMKDFEAKKLREVDQMKSKFFENISHEFRTPLTLIKGPIEKLLENESIDDKKKVYGLVLKNSERLLNLINELLNLSKLESGKMKLSAQKADIVSFAKGIAMSFESFAKKNNKQININSSSDSIELYFDKEKMQMILANLLSNAFKFTDINGMITVAIDESRDKNNVSIKIKDNGIGIAKEELPKIFDRFYQVNNTDQKDNIGTGIGLSLTKELVEMHCGEISVVSEEGKGSEFTVTFKFGRDHLKPEEIISVDEVVQNKEEFLDYDTVEFQNEDTEKPLILIIEDNKDVRNFIISIIKQKYNYAEAADGKEGLAKSLECIPDLIISDIMMPKMMGDEMTERLKNNVATCHIPIILLTAKASDEEKLKGLETGADDYLIKPFNEKELLVRINNLIAQRKKLRNKYLKEAEINPSEVAVTSLDKKFIENILSHIESNISNHDFGVDNLISRLALSRTQLYRKFSSVLGEKPNDFIRKYRIRRAAELIRKDFGNITEIAYEVGFKDLSYFSKCFKKLYKITPYEYAKLYVEEQNN